jgi:hypothetical protein
LALNWPAPKKERNREGEVKVTSRLVGQKERPAAATVLAREGRLAPSVTAHKRHANTTAFAACKKYLPKNAEYSAKKLSQFLVPVRVTSY